MPDIAMPAFWDRGKTVTAPGDKIPAPAYKYGFPRASLTQPSCAGQKIARGPSTYGGEPILASLDPVRVR
jgi:hypothetical protein